MEQQGHGSCSWTLPEPGACWHLDCCDSNPTCLRSRLASQNPVALLLQTCQTQGCVHSFERFMIPMISTVREAKHVTPLVPPLLSSGSLPERPALLIHNHGSQGQEHAILDSQILHVYGLTESQRCLLSSGISILWMSFNKSTMYCKGRVWPLRYVIALSGQALTVIVS